MLRLREIDFFLFSLHKSYFFCLKFSSMQRILSFKVLHVEIAQQVQNLKFSLILDNFLIGFKFCLIYFGYLWGKNYEKGQIG